MAEQHPTDRTDETEPRSSPQTDPTNPHHQEAAGVWVPNERASERRADEQGLRGRPADERNT